MSLEQSGAGVDRRVLPRAPERDRPAVHRGAAAAVHGRHRLPARARRRRRAAAADRRRDPGLAERRRVRRRAAGRADHRRGRHRAAGDRRDQRRRRVQRARDPARRAPARRRGPHRRPRDHLPRDRRPGAARAPRAMRDGNAPTMARWIADHGYHLAEWETDLSSQTGASQAGILLGSNENIPAFRWVEKETATTDGLLERRRLRRDRAPALHRHRAAGRRRREPREPALRRGGRGDPHGQPARRREARQPGLPRLPGQRLQRHAAARAVRVGGRARGDGGGAPEAPRRPPARASRRHLSVPARARCASSCAT